MISALILSVLMTPPNTDPKLYMSTMERHCLWMAEERKVTIADAAARLESRDEEVRSLAASDLACFGEKARPYIPKMIRLFNARHGEIQAQAVGAVMYLGVISVPFLIKALDERDYNMRDNTLQALAGLGPKAKAALEPLKARLGKKGYDSASLNWVIGRIEERDVYTFKYPQ
jgi:HEAT repeat protein